MKLRITYAIASLALLVCLSTALAQDNDDNLATLRSAANAGDLRGLFALGNRFLHGQGVQQDYSQALAYFRAAADQGFAPAQNQLGVMYERGLGTPKDYLGAMNYYRQAANQNYPLAQYNVGRLYDAGLGTRVDNQRAFEWFTKAANQGQPDAQDSVGFYYQRGVGAPQVFPWAMDWYQKAANQGSAQAQNDIGHMYQGGLGVQRDYEQALSWYYKAAEQGNSDAQVNIGYMYEHGLGLEPDFTQAQMWYRRAAAQGNTTAANNLGYIYDKGEGVTPDYGRALVWYQIAANQGHKTAAENIELLRKKLQSTDPDQWEAANSYARRMVQEQAERIARTKNSAWEAAELELDARQEESLANQRNIGAPRGAYSMDPDSLRAEAQRYRYEAARLRKSLTQTDDQQTADFSPRTSPSSDSYGSTYSADAATRTANPELHPINSQVPVNDDDPPSRVAQLRYIRGSVSFEPAGTDDWATPSLNRPMTTGDKLWADRGARAELGTDSAKIRLDSTTGFSFLNLNDHITQIRLTEGSLQIHLRRLDDDESFEVDTPNLALSLLRPGNYRLDVNEAGDVTAVTVSSGQGEVTAGGVALPIRAGQAGTFTGIDQISQDIEPIQGGDDFDDWCRNQDRRQERAQSVRYVSPDVIGYEDLDDYGEWRHTSQYGDVWVPTSVGAGWAPYRNGHWAWVAPWGWTWVDDAPWGFAPFHYGRWAYVNGYWAWCPGPVSTAAAVVARPVYAPALVAWIGSPRLGNSVGVGWLPLAPREVYVPPYHTSPTYVTQVNVTNTTVNTTVINNLYNNTTNVTNVNVTNVTYVNKTAPGAVTAVSQSAFTSAQPVAKVAVPVDARQLAVARVGTNTVGVAPQVRSVIGNVTPAVNVPKPPDSVQNRPVVAKVAPPPQPVSFAVQQKIIQQNGGRPVSAAEIQRVQVQQHIAPPAANPVVKVAPPVAAQHQNDAKQDQRDARHDQRDAKHDLNDARQDQHDARQDQHDARQDQRVQNGRNDAKQDDRAQNGRSDKENANKPVGVVTSPDQTKQLAPPNGPVRDMRNPGVKEPPQPQVTNATNKSDVKANSQTPAQPAVLQQPAVLPKVADKNDARKDRPPSVQAPVQSQAPLADNKPGDSNSRNASPTANDKAKTSPQISSQPAVEKPEPRKDQPVPAQPPVSKPPNVSPQSTPPATNNNPGNRPPAPAPAAHQDQQKQPDPKAQQKPQPAQPDKKKSDKPDKKN